MFEGGIIHPDAEDYSWFADFEEGGYYRLRFALDRWLKSGKWGLGIEGGYLLAGDGSGFRGGPVLTIPYGQIGYRLSSGSELANSSGPWASLRYSAFSGVEVYAYGSMTTYEWEAFDIESEDLMALHTGASYEPEFFAQNIQLFAEFQIYQSPEFNQDRRALGGITYKFDSERKGK